MAFGQLGALGAGFSHFGSLQTGPAILPPILNWNGDTSDATPNFDVDLPFGTAAPLDAIAGDVLRLQYSSNSGVSWNAYLAHTLTDGEIAGSDPITVSGVSALSNATYIFRARLERGQLFSAWSASVSVTINASSTAGQPIGLLLALTKAS